MLVELTPRMQVLIDPAEIAVIEFTEGKVLIGMRSGGLLTVKVECAEEGRELVARLRALKERTA